MRRLHSRRSLARNVIAAVVALILSSAYVDALHWALDIGQIATANAPAGTGADVRSPT